MADWLQLSQAFQRLGSQVTLVEMADRILSQEDQDSAELLAQQLQNEGIDLKTGHKGKRFEQPGRWWPNTTVKNSGYRSPGVDNTGREANVSGFGLEELGVETDRTINTNELHQTNYPNIYACGNVVILSTPMASHQAWWRGNALFDPFKTSC